jgi:hypothetical protein
MLYRPLVSAANITTTANISGGFILGNGSALTGIAASAVVNGTSNIVVSASGNISAAVSGVNNSVLIQPYQTNFLGITTTPKSLVGNVTMPGNTNGGAFVNQIIANGVVFTIPDTSTFVVIP